MIAISWPGQSQWTSDQKIGFRFFCIYFLLYIEPWGWIDYIPYGNYISQYYTQFINWLVEGANRYLFNQYKELIYPNGSGDTSYNWTQLWLYLLLAFIGCLIWSIFDRKKSNYNRLSYWVRIVVRYFLIINCFNYGIIKLFSLQMPFPNLSQLATPLGDYLPMRLSWMNMGYSTKYQFFSGAMEVLAGLLMLYRKTSTFGTLLAAGVFANVMVMNMSYDIPVKLYSTHLLIMCLYLLSFEYKRIVDFFVLNRATIAGNLYSVKFPKKWMRISRIVLKCLFVLVVVILPFINSRDRYYQVQAPREIKPIPAGIYDVSVYVLNKDTLPALINDTLRWQDIIFEKGGFGSIKTTDTMFRQRYRRGYFNYETDTTSNEISFKKTMVTGETFQLFKLKYNFPDSNTIHLVGTIRQDSVLAVLKKSKRHFQLAERQFHWLSEYNR